MAPLACLRGAALVENCNMTTRTCFQRIDSPLGPMLLVASDRALKVIDFTDSRGVPPIATEWREDAEQPVLCAARAQIAEYFAGLRAAFELPLAPEGTPFQQAVWTAIATVPAGATI